ncbi:AsmA-like C-terminal region-containing protein [Pseudaeromonas sp. ZJS20]|uniref:AsmA family protein n=1 Tax=Pseudaeromonas aegiceratis TaxID=3153928 RepID=UPI00390CD48C
MQTAIRFFLYSLLALILLIWIGLGLLNPSHLRAPLSAWVEQQTGLPLTINKLDYNPLYPNIVLAEGIKLGDVLTADKIYLEVAEGSWFQRSLVIRHLDLVRPRLTLKDGQSWPSFPLAQLKVEDLNLTELALNWPDGQLGGVSLHLGNWQPVQDGRWQPLQQLGLTGRIGRLRWHNLELADLELDGQWQANRLQLDHLSGKGLDGRFTLQQLTWDPAQASLQAASARLEGNRLDLDHAPKVLPVQQLQLGKLTLDDISLSQASAHRALNRFHGQLEQLNWQAGHNPQLRLKGEADELAWGSLWQLEQPKGQLELNADDPSPFRLDAGLWQGQLSLAGQLEADGQTLTLERLSLDKGRLELPADWRQQLTGWPRVQLRRLDVGQLNLISFDDALPLSLKGGELFATDLLLDQLGLHRAGERARLEASWLELAYGGLVGRQGELAAEWQADDLRLKQLTTQLQGGQLNVSGQWSPAADGKQALQLSWQPADLQQVSAILQPSYPFDGKGQLQLDLQAQGNSWAQIGSSLSGQVSLTVNDGFLEGIALDQALDDLLQQKTLPEPTPWSALLGQLPKGDTAFNPSRLQLTAQDGRLSLAGSAASSITHLLAWQGGVDLAKGQWDLQWALLDSHYCPALTAHLSGPLAEPSLQVAEPQGCQPWHTTPVTYPPQGRQSKLRS